MRFNLGLDRFSGLYLLVIFIVVFSFLAPSTFPTIQTLHIIASSQAVVGIVALAVLVPMIAGQFDLSIGANANLAGICALMLQTSGKLGAIPAVLVGIGIGLVIGFVNGLLVVVFKVNSFIGTLAMTSVLAALLLIVSGSEEVPPGEFGPFQQLAQTSIFGFQSVILFTFALALVAWWVIERTPQGRYLRAVGQNPEAARLTGLPVNRLVWLSLIASGGIAAFGGVLFVSSTGPSLDFGPGLLLPTFAAAFLGSTQIQPGRENVWGTLVAIFVLSVGVQGLQLVTGVVWVAPLFNGLALMVAVAVAVGRQSRTTRSKSETPGDSLEPPGGEHIVGHASADGASSTIARAADDE